MKILHAFADAGAEADTLAHYGDVVRVGINARPNSSSDAIKADVNALPLTDNAQFTLGVFHPPCTKWSTMPDANKNGDAPDLIPLSRKMAAKYCDDWIIENRPNAPLKDPVKLTGHMFGLPIEYERAFETSFPVEQPRRQDKLAEMSPFFYSNRSKEWWVAVKGCSDEYSKEHTAKNTIPAAYLNYLMQHWAKVDDTVNREGYVDRDKYDDYDAEISKCRAQEANATLTEWN